MEIKGKVIQLLDIETGEGKNGVWRKMPFVIEIPGSYPKKVCIDVWGDKIEAYNLQIDEEVEVSIDIESREYNGRWYTNIKAWNVKRDQNQVEENQSNNEPPEMPKPPTESEPPEALEDDLPF